MGSSPVDQSVTVTLTDAQLKTVHALLEHCIQDFYDDYSAYCNGPALDELRAYHKHLVELSLAVGFDFIGCVDRVASRNEKREMGRILAGANSREEIEKMGDFDCPEALSQIGQKAYDIVEKWRIAKGYLFAGGCRTYYSPEEWKERGEEYGRDAALIIVHDGGDLSSTHIEMSLDKTLMDALAAEEFYITACTHWYEAVYYDPPKVKT